MADIGWRPPPPTHFHASGRRFTHNSSGQSKNPLTAITVSTAILARGLFSRPISQCVFATPASASANYDAAFTVKDSNSASAHYV